MRAREGAELKRIEAARAKERQGERNDIVENLPQCSGRSRDKAAAEVKKNNKTIVDILFSIVYIVRMAILYVKEIDEELKRRFKAHCAANGTNMKAEIERLMKEELARKGRKVEGK